MPTIALPNIINALSYHVNQCPELAVLIEGRASGSLRKRDEDDPYGWPMPCAAILFVKAGGPGGDRDVQMQRLRVDAHCYGKNPVEADRVWMLLQAYLCPPQGDPLNAWVAKQARVWMVDQAGGEYAITEPNTGWPKIFCSYFVMYSEVPVL